VHCVLENTTLQCCCNAGGMHNSRQCHVTNQIVLISCARVAMAQPVIGNTSLPHWRRTGTCAWLNLALTIRLESCCMHALLQTGYMYSNTLLIDTLTASHWCAASYYQNGQSTKATVIDACVPAKLMQALQVVHVAHRTYCKLHCNATCHATFRLLCWIYSMRVLLQTAYSYIETYMFLSSFQVRGSICHDCRYSLRDVCRCTSKH